MCNQHTQVDSSYHLSICLTSPARKGQQIRAETNEVVNGARTERVTLAREMAVPNLWGALPHVELGPAFV